ncbi:MULTISPECIES: tetratricopeptide repeat protein [unclassified Chryseobacterium]|uniref:tetratricopeptide repeat protein n=1 Tax=unclassified Chryseobacterium TaxID=2593645 RepID=UPI001E30D598|nr:MULTISPECIES: tetratricopeptide repeat protein [unclassified Chryseobacterium]
MYEDHVLQLKKYWNTDRSDSMLYHGEQALVLARALGDKQLEGRVNVYLGSHFYEQNESSSTAYYYFRKAYQAYRQAKDTLKMAKTLLRMGILEKNTRQFIKSKESCIQALEFIGNKKTDFADELYNNLGITYNELGDLQRCVSYYKKSLELREQSGNNELILQTLNNMATAYKTHKDFTNSAYYYSRALQYPLAVLEKYPEEYARIIDNNAHLHFLQQKNNNVLKDYLKALEIRKKIGHDAGIVISKLHLAEYYRRSGDYEKSNSYAQQAHTLAQNTGNYRDALTAMELLSSNYKNSGKLPEALRYAKGYDSLLKKVYHKELNVGEKFADIRYESKEKEKENKDLKLRNQLQQLKARQQRIYLYAALGLLVLLIITSVLYVRYSRLKAREKSLLMQQKELEAEKEIESLLLQQQGFAEKAKQREQERISHDLHDSIAGKISGTMLGLDALASQSESPVKEKLDTSVQYMKSILDELGSIVYDMNRQKIIDVSYKSLLEQLIDNQLSRSTRSSLTIASDLDWNRVSNRIKIACYYIIQQGLRNIQQHACASEAEVKCYQKNQKFHLEILDNGIGIDPDKPSNIGIPGMKKRTESVGGTFSLHTEKSKGTTLYCTFPLS